MAELVRVVVDAMGGDNAPAEPVRGAVEAVKARKDIQVLLTGQKDVIEKEMAKYPDCPKEQIEIVHASEVIETAEPPVFAIRKKKDSSIVVGLNMIKTGGRCICIIRKHRSSSCGRTGPCGKKQRRGAAAPCPSDSDKGWSCPSD